MSNFLIWVNVGPNPQSSFLVTCDLQDKHSLCQLDTIISTVTII